VLMDALDPGSGNIQRLGEEKASVNPCKYTEVNGK